MKGIILYPASNTTAMRFAQRELQALGIRIVNSPAPDVTHFLLPVPSFESDGRIRGGGILEHLLAKLPDSVTVIGGNLDHPSLAGYHTIDLLKDPVYLAENAAVTADCALRVAGRRLQTTFRGCPILVIGWGRIGKHLASMLQRLGANTTVAARKGSDRALLKSLGFHAADPANLEETLSCYRVIFNTVPAPILSDTQTQLCRLDCLKIDLASSNGICGSNVIPARGLPGKETPETAGKLIAETSYRLLLNKESAS